MCTWRRSTIHHSSVDKGHVDEIEDSECEAHDGDRTKVTEAGVMIVKDNNAIEGVEKCSQSRVEKKD